MKLKDYLQEESATNITLQFYDIYNTKEKKIEKMVEFKQGNKTKKFKAQDIEKNVPKPVLEIARKKLSKELGMPLDNISAFKDKAKNIFKYKDGMYDISFLISDNGEQKNGRFNVDKGEIEKFYKGKLSPAQIQMKNHKKSEKFDVKKTASEIKKERLRKPVA